MRPNGIIATLFGLLLGASSCYAEDWTTTDGKTFKNVTVIKHDFSTVTILNDDGGATIPLANLPPDLQKKFDYDPVKAAQALVDQAKAAEEAKKVQIQKAHDQLVAAIQLKSKTIREVQADQSHFVDTQFFIQGTISLDTYYSFKYTDSEPVLYSFRIDQDGQFAHAYMEKTNPIAIELHKKLLAANGPISGCFSVKIDSTHYDSNSSEVLATLLNFYSPTPEK